MQVLAALLGLGGAGCLYLASPNQRLLPSVATTQAPGRGTRLCCAATLAVAISGWAWSTTQGWPSAIAATLATVGTGLSLWPFMGAWLDARRQRRAKASR
ncbi:hypothetical protein OR16_07069 [Cupriavidus basilensis OR16]|uniref:Transmembrane lipoprotein n=1 Tax=Cupriavidus basilensis OR16 TaxID=1127483 RepID=H1S112_9BURK|nr:hypothetical protein [Cupriavidus basilensis]EHP43828.1 hypothetical protein OR16_07069 [Cupriavidus basilensis OR16]